MVKNDQKMIENYQEMIENDQKSHGALIMGPKGALIIMIIIRAASKKQVIGV